MPLVYPQPQPSRPAQRLPRPASLALLVAAAALTTLGCGNTYRPVVTAINPVGPAGQPVKFAVAIASNGAAAAGVVTIVDVSGNTVLDTTAIGNNPYYLQLSSNGGQGFSLNGDGTVNAFPVSLGLRSNDVQQITLLPGSAPVAALYQGQSLYITTPGRNSVGQFRTANNPPSLNQELQTGSGTTYTVGTVSAPRVYALVAGTGTTAGRAAAIETTTNALSTTLPVGINPVYGVMSADTNRAYVLNKGSNTVTVINAQKNALDTFTTSAGTLASTIQVGVAPVWADFAPTLNELVVANAGNGTTAGSVTIISIPSCSVVAAPGNPACDPSNLVDGLGFGTVLANIPVGVNPVMVAVLQDGTQAYVANAGNAAAGIAGSVSVINLSTNTVVATLPASNSTNAADALVHGHPGFLAVTTGTPTGKVYVTAPDSTDLTIIRTDLDTVQGHVALQGAGQMVRVTAN